MTEYVFRRMRHGVRERLYRGRYALERGETPREVALGTPDKRVALKRLRDIVVEAQREREGLVAPRAQREAAALPLAQLVNDYEADMRSRGRSHGHVRTAMVRIRRAIAGTGWKRLADIRPDEFSAWRSTLTVSAKTAKDYQANFIAFLNWLVAMRRIPVNPLAGMPRIDTRGKSVRKSRAFTLTELRNLCAVAPASRRIVYQVLAYTGLRAGEVRALVWGDLNLEEERPHLLVREETTKDRSKRPVPLHPVLAAELRAYRERVAKLAMDGADQRVFIRFPDYGTLRADFTRAGIEHRDATGRVVHFHAFRKTFQTLGVKYGINQRAAQELLGHSDANLTAQVYTDVPALALHTEVAKLPWVNEMDGGAGKSVRPAVASRLATLCRDLIDVVESFDLQRVAQELESAKIGVPCGIRTRVLTVKGWCPGPG